MGFALNFVLIFDWLVAALGMAIAATELETFVYDGEGGKYDGNQITRDLALNIIYAFLITSTFVALNLMWPLHRPAHTGFGLLHWYWSLLAAGLGIKHVVDGNDLGWVGWWLSIMSWAMAAVSTFSFFSYLFAVGDIPVLGTLLLPPSDVNAGRLHTQTNKPLGTTVPAYGAGGTYGAEVQSVPAAARGL